MEILKLFYKKQPRIIVSLFSIVGDLLIFAYIYHKFNNYSLFKEMINIALTASGMSLDQIPQNLMQEEFHLMINTIILMFALIMVVHLIAYILFIMKKEFARKYVVILAWFGAPSFAIIGLSIMSSSALALPFFLQAGLYTSNIFTLKKMGTKKVLPNLES